MSNGMKLAALVRVDEESLLYGWLDSREGWAGFFEVFKVSGLENKAKNGFYWSPKMDPDLKCKNYETYMLFEHCYGPYQSQQEAVIGAMQN